LTPPTKTVWPPLTSAIVGVLGAVAPSRFPSRHSLLSMEDGGSH
jgi:hypothetical protein